VKTARLPDGPRLPRALQTAAFIFGGERWLARCHRRYGSAATFRTTFASPFVVLFDPKLVGDLVARRELHHARSNRVFRPMMGKGSVLTLDGPEHQRHRRLLLSALVGRERRSLYVAVIRDATDRAIESWPVDVPFTLVESLRQITMAAVANAAMSFDVGPDTVELARRASIMIDELTGATHGPVVRLARDLRRRRELTPAFHAARDRFDELLYREIGDRREDVAIGIEPSRPDVLDALIAGELDDERIRDELATVLIAGYETTATALAWCFDLLLHTPDAYARALQREPDYVDAIVKESLRLQPVFPGFGRMTGDRECAIDGYDIPAGVDISPSTRSIHRSDAHWPDAHAFAPERFLDDDPSAYTWMPFGAGNRRCVGSSFALMEMRTVLDRILERTELHSVKASERARFRLTTQCPRHGVRVVCARRDA
jgi:cytochrome P450